MASLMLPSLVLGLITLQAVADTDPVALVRQLASSKYEDREAAGEELVTIGRAALPALWNAVESRDPEIRLRAESLLGRIEARELLKATLVKLDIRDLRLAEAAEVIAKDSGMPLRWGEEKDTGEARAGWPERRVTLEAAEPIPFSEVIDRLCRAGGLQREHLRADPSFSFSNRPFTLSLVPGQAQPPASDHGALRVELLRVHHRRERGYDHLDPLSPRFQRTAVSKRDSRTGVIESSSYAAELLVSAEPRLRIFGVGLIESPEAIDDQGRSLLKVPTADEEKQQLALWRMNPHLDPRLHPALRYSAGSRPSQGAWLVSLPLSYPSPPAQQIVTLRGIIPVVVVSRRADPLVVELKGASGQDFSAGSARITVHKISAERGREPTVDFTLETDQPSDNDTIIVRNPQGVRMAVRRPNDLMELSLEVLDGHGESLSWRFTRAPTRRIQGRMSIVIRGRNADRVNPDELRLRYWRLVGAATDLPFAFQDVPTP